MDAKTPILANSWKTLGISSNILYLLFVSLFYHNG